MSSYLLSARRIISVQKPLLELSYCVTNVLAKRDFQLFKGSPIPRFRTVKRRSTYPRKWWVKKDAPKHSRFLEPSSRRFVDEMVASGFGVSPVNSNELSKPSEWTPQSRRCALIGKKIGVHPYWTKEGKLGLASLVQVTENHVIKSYSVEETKNHIIHQDRWKSDGLACMMVGSETGDPQRFTSDYCQIFTEAGVLPKKKLARFFVSEDALLKPGTRLTVSHFRVGDWVDVYGKTIDHGFQGVMIRWKFRGLPDRNTTKAHRRPGSISFGRRAAGPLKGKKMPGRMGGERRTLNGVQILKIDHENQVIYLKGPAVPGEIGSYVYLFDSKIFGKRPSEINPPPFPTSFESSSSEKSPDLKIHGSIHVMESPTIMFKEEEKEKKTMRTGAKLAKIRTK